jgi:hypothetical protein
MSSQPKSQNNKPTKSTNQSSSQIPIKNETISQPVQSTVNSNQSNQKDKQTKQPIPPPEPFTQEEIKAE